MHGNGPSEVVLCFGIVAMHASAEKKRAARKKKTRTKKKDQFLEAEGLRTLRADDLGQLARSVSYRWHR